MKLLCISLLILLTLAVVPWCAADDAKADTFWVYVGTYTGKKSQGIYRFELDLATGKLSNCAVAAELTSPSFLAIHPQRRFLYAVSEISTVGKKKGGGVTAFSLDAKTGELKRLNQQSSVGAGPCHINVDRSGKSVLVANYSGGNSCLLPLHADGSLAEASSVMHPKGASTDKKRQQGPHAHSINVAPDNRFAFVADLGLDKVLVYRLDPVKGTLTPNDPPAIDIAPGSGPRHFAFHPDGKHAYVINELANTITAMSYDADNGVLKAIQTISTLPDDFQKTSYTAEVVVHPSGKFVYGSNRGHDSIAVFQVEEGTGKLKAAGHASGPIKTPRNFAIEPTGKYLLVGNQGADSVVVYRIDARTGQLTQVGEPVEVPAPVCLRFVAKGK